MTPASTGSHHDNLPSPGADAIAHSNALVTQISHVIEQAGGAISFAAFMQHALYSPGLGYYSGGLQKFGKDGDFTTAPEISPLFSQCLATQCAQVLAELGHADILECGAGSGIMAATILNELDALGQLPDRYYILELSSELQQRQAETVQQVCPHLFERVQWLAALPVSGFRGIVLGNELIDAMPVERFVSENGNVMEQVVCFDGTRLVLRARPASEQLVARIRHIEQQLGTSFQDGYESEVNFAADGWLHSVSTFMDAGMILLVDYGFPRHEFYHPQRNGGTLMCHYRHRAHPDAMILVGLQDITAHVDFTALAEAANDDGFNIAGFTTQAHFLLSLGIEQRVGSLAEDEQLKAAQQLKQLVLPSEMGELFKAIAFTRDITQPLQGFAFQDQRHRL